MRVFLTGGSGFIGGHLLERLRSKHDFVALARSDASEKAVRGLGATAAARADLASVGPEHLKGCDAVIHCAARAEEWGTRAQFFEANVTATQHLLSVDRAAGVPRFVHVGTEAALFNGAPLVDVDETCPYAHPQRFLYSETKAEAERYVLAANTTGFTTLSVRPRMVWGPRDTTILPVVLRMVDSGQWRWVDAGRHLTSTTHVYNVVHGLDCALARGEGGNAYFVADEGNHTIHQFVTALMNAHGRTVPDRTVPGWVARALAAALEAAWTGARIQGPPPMSRLGAAVMSATCTVKTDKARRELGYAPVISFEEGLRSLTKGEHPHP